MSVIKEYTIDVPQQKIDRLKKRLDDTDFPSELEGNPAWDYGSPLADIQRLVEYWRTKFDWRAHEKKLNELPNFEVQVSVDKHGPVDMHFVHQKSDVQGAIPLLFVHGWPGSFLEVTKMLPYLKGGDGNPAFHVVAPSLPNYGFSGPALKPGFNLARYAEACHKVMLALGYNEYVTQGGDWGFLITRALAHLYPTSVKAHHINWAWAAKPEEFVNGTKPEPEYSEREKKQMALAERWNPFGMGDGRGYLAIQSTRPATINFLLRDSPVGNLAWVFDKLVEWSDEYEWTDDEVCLWVSIYVFSRAGPDAASYIYYEALHDPVEITVPIAQGYIDVPLGIADFPVELCNSPVSWRHTMGPIVFQKFYEKGGHFAGWERPKDLADGLCEMFGKGGGAYGVVSGKDGY
ncbi:uncharacterized protein MYCFIDRAFT_63545 [Pseudocercospora fijiensis CIRAD86]|uniref:Epoxide hydrolase N-terminal domain-containing protein n=1 Tax=Pseudocercospora fijiensis (strain CIRAD86) TaxID=383855 RepID=M3A2S0_PSEFD|nr:uncharacterized protein MYCFIDRAFT_63545 [Pseudocercospora fijiensis CIRAD86]EME78691.1 hypothetical protein MYCFIDRAFT_63545 [Pseudocercospora fijiensis CIRAD86]